MKDPTKTRSVILIHTDILTNNWTQMDFKSGDVTVIRLKGDWGMLTLCNVYNDCDHDDMVGLLRTFQRKLEETDQGHQHKQMHTIWLRDFNWHHL